MNVPFGDLKLHYNQYKQQLDEAAARVLSSGYYILGPELDRFEKAFAEWLGAGYVVGCASGTEAIYLALAALGVGRGDEVLTVAHTAVPTISAISMTGAEPVFVDIDPVTYVMDPAKVEAKVTKRTKAIVPVHLYGQTADMESLLKLGSKLGIPIMEDCAQSTGSKFRNMTTGTMGVLGAFSFYPSKNLGAFGDGGAVSTDSKEMHERLLRLRNYGQSKRYYHDEVGINSRLDEIQSAILGAQLPFVSGWNERRREIAARYTNGLAGVCVVPKEAPQTQHVYHLYVIQTGNRDALQKYLTEKGIGTLIHYPVPAHLQKAYQYRGYKAGELPVTETLANRILSLPMFPQLTDEQIDRVIDAIGEFHRLNPGAVLTDETAYNVLGSDRVAQTR